MAEAAPASCADLLDHALARVRTATAHPFLLGVAGPPATGESTLAQRLVDDLSQAHGLVLQPDVQSLRRAMLLFLSRSPRSSGRPQFLKLLDQLPYVGGRCSRRSLAALGIANRGGSVLAAAIVGPAICLPITIEESFKLSDDLLARGVSSRRAEEGPVRVFEMEQEPVLEARCRDGRGELHSAFLPEWVLLQPVTESSDFRGSFVVVEDAPDLVQIGIQIALLLNRCRDARRSPLSALRASDRHARKIEVADESQEVAWLGPGSFAQDQDSRQTRPSSGSSSRGARLSSPGLSCGHRARILR